MTMSKQAVKRVVTAVLTGIVMFGVVAVGVTAALDKLIWPSAIVGLPTGLIAGLVLALATYRYLGRRDARKEN